MRNSFYLLSLASCGLLVYLHVQRGQYVWAVLIGLVAVIYGVRMWLGARKDRDLMRRATEAGALAAATRGSSAEERRNLIEGLLDTRKKAATSRSTQLVTGIVIMAIASIVYPENQLLALAMLIFLLPLLWLVFRNSRVIREIDQGLSKHVAAAKH